MPRNIIDRLSKIQEAGPASTMKGVRVSKRTLHRVQTEGLNLEATLTVGIDSTTVDLVNISAAGCALRAVTPVPATIRVGALGRIALVAGTETLSCDCEVLAVDEDADIGIRLRFRRMPPHVHRMLIEWIGTLARRDFQRRYAANDGDRA